ncbi:MAG: CPBP family intramembrane metalloprotease [Dehalococcoidia bacterium]|nr:CPBP family intramembrane metalloprotease [Dehalococcoidia bacterium]
MSKLGTIILVLSASLGGGQLRKSIGKHPVASFLIITFAWGWMFYVPAALVIDEHPEQTGWLVAFQTLGAASPLLAGHVVRQAGGGWSSVAHGWRRYTEWRLPVWIYVAAILVLPSVGGLTALLTRRPGDGLLELWENLGPLTAVVVPMSIAAQLASSPLLEEYGWRGFLQPCLQERHRALPSALFVGALWGLHHLPLAIGAGLPVGETIVGAVGPSIIAAWLLNEGRGSMVGVMLLHASLNVAIQVIAPDGLLFDILIILVAGGVVTFAGPLNLARRPRFVLAAEQRPRSSAPGPLRS